MLQFFMNPLMLIGLAGVALPVLAHLLSRSKFDVVNWGAMQFLNPSRKTRQKMRLEELLLLLVRIGIIALLGFAFARPWINSWFLMGYSSAGNRDVVLIIDGSNSMARSDGLTSLHQKAMRRAKEFLTTLGPGDTVSLIDARDLPIKVVDSPIQDFQLVSEKIDSIPPASGAVDLRRSCEEAVVIFQTAVVGRHAVGTQTEAVAACALRCIATCKAARRPVRPASLKKAIAGGSRGQKGRVAPWKGRLPCSRHTNP